MEGAERRMPKYVESEMPIAQQIDLKNARALKEQVETQNLLIQYIAAMSDIYIPEDESEVNGNVSDSFENEG